MFSQIKGIVDLLTSGFKTLRDFKSEADRERSIVDLLRLYFLLQEVVNNGEDLIVQAGSNPEAKIAALSDELALALVKKWDLQLRQQASRLYEIQRLLFAQDSLAVLNPELLKTLDKALGNKMNRAVSLHGIGAALVIRCMFPLNETPVQIASLISTMAGERKAKINLGRIRVEVLNLRESLEQYREHVNSLATKSEIMKLSKRAKQSTVRPTSGKENS
jgi:hypothetical protein